MLKALLGGVVLVALGAAVAVVPLHGRTVLERWRAAGSAAEFGQRAWAELRGAPAGATARAGRPADPARPGARSSRAHPPAEYHTPEDRAALERIVAEHARR